MRSHAIALLLFCSTAGASTLTVNLNTRPVGVGAAPRLHIDHVIFADEPLTATVKLDVYAIPNMMSTTAHLDALQKLTDKTWTSHLVWSLRAGKETRPIEVDTIDSHVRHMGPGSKEPAAKTVPFTAYEGRFRLPNLEPSQYTLSVGVDGLDSTPVHFVIASGREPEYRDAYLDLQASRASSYSDFRRLELERLRLDPTKAGALLALAARAQEEGSLQETMDYYDRAVAVMEKNVDEYARIAPQWGDEQRVQLKRDVERIRSLQRLLPTYFAQRVAVRLATDPLTGKYRLIDRKTGRVVQNIE